MMLGAGYRRVARYRKLTGASIVKISVDCRATAKIDVTGPPHAHVALDGGSARLIIDHRSIGDTTTLAEDGPVLPVRGDSRSELVGEGNRNGV